MNLSSLILTARYVRRAAAESGGTLRGLRRSLEEQIELASVTTRLWRRLNAACCCDVLPLDLSACVACMLATKLSRVAIAADKPSAQHWQTLDSIRETLDALRYDQ
jgi:hypothetical protein